jgi:O-acetyl-ADP-ribose deacetylase (regulator of RNase III)/uncharacterized protein YwgA
MIKVLVGDIFESTAQTLVNTVNCVGVMGKGIALEFKKRFPEMYEDYVRRCEQGEVRLGKPYLFKSFIPPWVLNFPTKDHWRSLAKIEDIINGLEYLVEHYKEWGITSIAVPPLGTGLGQLEWRVVGPILYRYLSRMDINVELYAPYGTATDELELSFLIRDERSRQIPLKAPRPSFIKPSWAALVEILYRIESQRYHWPIGRTRFQKMAYIAEWAGLPLDLHFQRSSFGPYAPDLKQMVSHLMNNGLIREERSGNMFELSVGATYEGVRHIYSNDINQWSRVIDKLVDLFMRVDTRQAEIIATVIYAAEELRSSKSNKLTESDVVNAVMEWKQRRTPPLDEEQVSLTVRNLAALKWLNVEASENLRLPEHELFDA